MSGTAAARTAEELREQILELVQTYHDAEFASREFVPGETPVPVSGRVFDADELLHLVDASLDFWLTTGRYAKRFELEFAKAVGVRHALLCNSGSSANLLAVSALTSKKLGERRLQPGDEVITVAAGFPTTVNPIVLNRLVPVFVDVELGTYNLDVSQLEAAVGPRTRAIIAAHTLGNPFDLDAVLAFAKKHDLWLIEDNCDALGSTYTGQADRHVRRLRHAELLSRAPHHDGRGRRGAHEPAAAQAPDRVVPRLGPRLLVRAGRGQHVRPALRAPARQPPARLRPQVHLHAHRLQPEGHRHAGGGRRRAAGEARDVRRGAEAQLAAPPRGAEAVRGRPPPAAGDRAQRPELVRLPDHGSRGRSVRPQRARPPSRGAEDRDPAALRRQPHPPARLRGHRVPLGRRADEQRHRDEPVILDRRVSGPHATR